MVEQTRSSVFLRWITRLTGALACKQLPSAPVIARVAKEIGILTVGVVTKPFEFEGKKLGKQAEDGVGELEANVMLLCVVAEDQSAELAIVTLYKTSKLDKHLERSAP